MTGATGGFLYVPGMTGAPASSSGPTGYTGTVAHVFDVSNNMPWYLNPANTFGGSTGATPGWVAGNGQVLIQKVVLGGATGTVTFNNIPQVFGILVISGLARVTQAVSNGNIVVYYNNDNTSTNYYWQVLQGVGSVVSASVSNTAAPIAQIPGATAVANSPGSFTCTIYEYAGTTFYKTHLSTSGYMASSGSVSAFFNFAGQWINTNAITTVTLSAGGNTFVAGSTFRLYGIW